MSNVKMRELEEAGVTICVNSPAKELRKGSVVVEEAGLEKSIGCDVFIAAFGSKPNRRLYEALADKYGKRGRLRGGEGNGCRSERICSGKDRVNTRPMLKACFSSETFSVR